MSDPLADLASEVRAEGGLLAGALREAPAGEPLPAGPREELHFLLEAIREGQLLHEGRSRLFSGDDEDLSLLAGDRLYALGLERLAELGDLDAVDALADVIAGCARAAADGRPELADAAWEAGLTRVHRATSSEPGATGVPATAARSYSSER